MAEKYQMHDQQQVYPLAPSTGVPRSDAEYSATYESMELRKKKRMKCYAYIAAFAVFQTMVILVFALVVMKVKTPKVRLEDVTVINNGNGNFRLTAQVRVKNTNFGRYKFDGAIATLTSGSGVTVGQFAIPDGRAGMKSTKKFYIVVDITNPSGSGSGSNSGVLELTSQATLKGKVELMVVMKKKKSAEMDCTISVNLSTNALQDLRCK